jgi:hypothetical protein
VQHGEEDATGVDKGAVNPLRVVCEELGGRFECMGDVNKVLRGVIYTEDIVGEVRSLVRW